MLNVINARTLTRRSAIILGAATIPSLAFLHRVSAQETTQDPNVLLEQAVTAMAAVQSFHFSMTTPEGRSLVVDQIELSEFEGDVQRPNSFRVQFTAKVAFVSLTIKVIGIAEQLWVTDPMSRDESWIQVGTSDLGSIPLPTLLNPDSLLQAAISLVGSPTIVGEDEIDGVKTTRIDGTFDPRQANQQAAGVAGTPVPDLESLTGDQSIPISVWLDESARVRRVVFDGPLSAADEDDVVRQFDLTSIDEPVDIQPPA